MAARLCCLARAGAGADPERGTAAGPVEDDFPALGEAAVFVVPGQRRR